MKKFLLRSLFALVVLLAFNVFLIGLTYWVCSKTSFKLDDNKTVLVLGPSYLQAAIDPKYFPEAENVSASGTGKMFSYLKLKKFTQINPNINTIVISMTSSEMHHLDWYENALNTRVPTYFPLMAKEDVFLLLNNPYFYSGIIKSPLQHLNILHKSILHKSITYKDWRIGEFYSSKKVFNSDTAYFKIIKGFANEDEFVDLELYYHDKIVTYCKENNLNLVMVKAPQYRYYPDFYDYVRKKYSDITYLCYSEEPLKIYMADGVHLNGTGAKWFSQILRNDLISFGLIDNK